MMDKKVLYRDPVNGRLGGVCAGIAAYTGMERWLVRIITVSLCLLGGFGIVVILYIAACLILDKMPREEQQYQQASSAHQVKQRHWQAGQTPTSVLSKVNRELDQQDRRLQAMEAYVTSNRFKVDREFKNL